VRLLGRIRGWLVTRRTVEGLRAQNARIQEEIEILREFVHMEQEKLSEVARLLEAHKTAMRQALKRPAL
jgi:hypothetical protein